MRRVRGLLRSDGDRDGEGDGDGDGDGTVCFSKNYGPVASPAVVTAAAATVATTAATVACIATGYDGRAQETTSGDPSLHVQGQAESRRPAKTQQQSPQREQTVRQPKSAALKRQ